MKAQFKLVLYCPRPCSGYRFPLGAVVRANEWEYVLINDALDNLNWSAIGFNPHFVGVLLAKLETDFSWHGDMTALGIGYPFIEMGEVMDVPDDVDDVQAFIEGIFGS